MERLPEEIEWYFDRFIEKIQELQDKVCSLSPFKQDLRVRVKKGRTYWAIWIDEYSTHPYVWKPAFEEAPESTVTSKRIFGFVRIKDGAILRAATWRGPEVRTKTAVRGYVYEENTEDYFNEFGITYAPVG